MPERPTRDDVRAAIAAVMAAARLYVDPAVDDVATDGAVAAVMPFIDQAFEAGVGVGRDLEADAAPSEGGFGAYMDKVVIAARSDARGPWRCERCGSDRWVGCRAGPEHEGWPRRAQCVPCGNIQETPRARDGIQ